MGDQITLKEGGDSELLKKTDYTVVGLGESPLYISYNRGNSTLGSGEVNGFAYVLLRILTRKCIRRSMCRLMGHRI